MREAETTFWAHFCILKSFFFSLSIPLILIRVAGRWSRSQLTLGEDSVHSGQAASPSRAFKNNSYI